MKKNVLRSQPKFTYFERHHDDEIYDHVEIKCIPRFKTSGLSGDEWRISYVTNLYRKGTLIKSVKYGKLEDAVAHLPWLIRTHLEEDGDRKEWSDRIKKDETTCHQPGCPDPATVVYRMKNHGSEDGRFVEPVGKDVELRRAFCDRHSQRGNSDRVDNDKNYTVISGAVRPVRPHDESPAVFAGYITLKDTDDKNQKNSE